MTAQAYIIEAAALVLLCCSVVLVRRQMLSIRYGLGWIAVAIAGIAIGPVLSVLSHAAHHIGFTPTGFSLGIIIFFLLMVSLQLSISLSGLHRQIQDLSEHGALLEQRIADLESNSNRSERDSGRSSGCGSRQ